MPPSAAAVSPRSFDLTHLPFPQYISAMIVRAVRLVGIDTQFFLGICARKGGLSTAIKNGVPEEIVWMQSGHANSGRQALRGAWQPGTALPHVGGLQAVTINFFGPMHYDAWVSLPLLLPFSLARSARPGRIRDSAVRSEPVASTRYGRHPSQPGRSESAILIRVVRVSRLDPIQSRSEPAGTIRVSQLGLSRLARCEPVVDLAGLSG
jgi:hypothetical protein